MASYTLIGSYPTVQVLSPSLVNDVIYCTIQTSPHSVIASMAVPTIAFDSGQGVDYLTPFADAIEQIMQQAAVIGAVGGQKIDPNGLISDVVVFTVAYADATHPLGTITADAEVPVASLNFTDGLIGATLLESVLAIIDGVYENLKTLTLG
jgi:hypothetical protein